MDLEAVKMIDRRKELNILKLGAAYFIVAGIIIILLSIYGMGFSVYVFGNYKTSNSTIAKNFSVLINSSTYNRTVLNKLFKNENQNIYLNYNDLVSLIFYIVFAVMTWYAGMTMVLYGYDKYDRYKKDKSAFNKDYAKELKQLKKM